MKQRKTYPTFVYLCLCLLHCFFISSAQAIKAPSATKRIKQLKKELRQVTSDCKKLEALNKKQCSKYASFTQRYSNLTQANIGSNQSLAPSKTQLQDSLLNDSNYLKTQIALKQQVCVLLRQNLEHSSKQFAKQNASLFSKELLQKQLPKAQLKELIAAQKQAYYLKESLANVRKDVLKKINIKSFTSQLNQAQLQQQKLLAQLKQPNFKLPAGYQTKASVRQSMGGNGATSSKQQLDKVKEKASQLNALLDSVNSFTPKDTLLFKPNPYKSMLLKQRIKPSFSWQSAQATGAYPAVLETMFGIRYLLSPRFTPQVSMSYKLGLGYNFNAIKLSSQGYCIQAGMAATVYNQVYTQVAYEFNYYPLQTDKKNDYHMYPGLVLGIGIRGKMGLFIGYDFLQKNQPYKASPLVIRFNF